MKRLKINEIAAGVGSFKKVKFSINQSNFIRGM